MEFICERAEILTAVVNCAKAVASKSNVSALESLKLTLCQDELYITGYDMELGIRQKISAESEDNAEILLNATLFGEILRNMPDGKVSFQTEERIISGNMKSLALKIKSGSTDFQIAALSAESYPELPEIEQEQVIEIPQSRLRSMILGTHFAIAQNDHKPVLKGQLLDIFENQVNMVASDSYRIALRTEFFANPDAKLIIPGKALSEVGRLMKDEEEKKCKISYTRTHIIFEMNDCQVLSRLLEGEFINYKNSIPTEFRTEVTMKTREFLSVLERCNLLVDEKNKVPVVLAFASNNLHISLKSAKGVVNDNISAEIKGESIKIGFNNRFLLEAVRSIDSDVIKLCFNGPRKLLAIMPTMGDAYRYLVMPIMLAE